jgi:hypothetical protein
MCYILLYFKINIRTFVHIKAAKMFKWIMSLFRKKKVDTENEPSIIKKPTLDNDYADIISKLSLDDTFFTPKDVKYMNTLTNAQLVYLILLRQ